jgi:hypothetical protein
MVWPLLEEPEEKAKQEVGPIAKLQAMWRALPVPNANQLDPKSTPLREQCLEMRDFVVKIRKHTAMEFRAPVVKGLPAGSQPLLNWKLTNSPPIAAISSPRICSTTPIRRRRCPIPRYPGLHQEAAPRWAALSAKARSGDADLVVPAAERGRMKRRSRASRRFSPTYFYVSERGRYFPDDSDDKGRF